MIMVHWLVLLFQKDCGFPKFPVAIMVPQNLFMLTLFGDFYYKTYIKKAKKKIEHTKKQQDHDDVNNNNNDKNSSPVNNNNVNNGSVKTMFNGNGITNRNNSNNCYPIGKIKTNGTSFS